mmetsp:Transcript_7175/g.21146  ORF Transcript_7175/g.21146 Transcript_7175/m.21146 type:complete len:269 (-) Transcript_7175:154-960(-)
MVNVVPSRSTAPWNDTVRLRTLMSLALRCLRSGGAAKVAMTPCAASASAAAPSSALSTRPILASLSFRSRARFSASASYAPAFSSKAALARAATSAFWSLLRLVSFALRSATAAHSASQAFSARRFARTSRKRRAQARDERPGTMAFTAAQRPAPGPRARTAASSSFCSLSGQPSALAAAGFSGTGSFCASSSVLICSLRAFLAARASFSAAFFASFSAFFCAFLASASRLSWALPMADFRVSGANGAGGSRARRFRARGAARARAGG